MYPNLYYAFNDLFGIDLPFLKMFQSFGFFVAISFLLCSYIFSIELKRKENEGLLQALETKTLNGKKPSQFDYITSIIIGFIIGYKFLDIVFNFNHFLENTQAFILSTQGNILGGLLFAAVFFYLKYNEAQKLKGTEPAIESVIIHPYQHVGNMTTIAAIAGLLGAKIFHNLENWDEFIFDPIGSLLSFSGLTMYGGLIFGAASVIYYARKNSIAIKPLIDACAPGLMLAYGVGRIGCQIAGDGDWGINNLSPKPNWLNFLPDWVWSYTYPHNVNGVGVLMPNCEGKYCAALPYPVFPTPFYEAIACILLFFVLWLFRKKIKTPGVLFSLYLMLNGVERFFIEKIRVNTQYHIFGYGITQAEIISTVLIILGATGIWWFKSQSDTDISKIESQGK
ncbi:MAG: prolipoprotein diacylglyceryl transferase [Bacteroidia bacterium]|nr:prolipoprotein diacylglyceryl transferase [Bacteroidia bacterium]